MQTEELGGKEMSSTGRGKFYGIRSMVVVSKSVLRRSLGNLHYIQLHILSHKKSSIGLSVFPARFFFSCYESVGCSESIRNNHQEVFKAPIVI